MAGSIFQGDKAAANPNHNIFASAGIAANKILL
jgi:hypothetical protein